MSTLSERIAAQGLEPDSLPPGAQVGLWQVKAMRGRGAYGIVYRDPEHRRGEYEGLLDPNELHSWEKAMTAGHPWEGNWKARLYDRVRERGYDSLTAFADARPTAPLHALAEEPGKDDVAGVQVLSGLLAEAEQRRRVTRFVRDVLVRMLSLSLPSGWPAVMADESRFAVAKALGLWSGYTPETHQERRSGRRGSSDSEHRFLRGPITRPAASSRSARA